MSYNGWKNYATWNVALWIGNDEGIYQIAKNCRNYNQFVSEIKALDMSETPDKVSWLDSELDFEALDEMIEEL